MKVTFLYKEENIEFIPIIEALCGYIKEKNSNMELNIKNEKTYECIEEDAVIILTNSFANFIDLYCLPNNKKKVMIFTNNTKESFIRMLLMIVKHISYIKCEVIYFKESKDFKRYLTTNNRRLYNNILNFIKYNEKVN